MSKKRLEGNYSRKMKMIDGLDPEIAQYFKETRLIKSHKKEKNIEDFEIGCNVEANNKLGIIIYGPYSVNNKEAYEVETEDGEIITALNDGSIKKIAYKNTVEDEEEF